MQEGGGTFRGQPTGARNIGGDGDELQVAVRTRVQLLQQPLVRGSNVLLRVAAHGARCRAQERPGCASKWIVSRPLIVGRG